MAQIKQSLEGLDADIAALRAAATPENRTAIINRFERISVELSLIDVRLGEIKLDHDRLVAPESAIVSRDREALDEAHTAVEHIAAD